MFESQLVCAAGEGAEGKQKQAMAYPGRSSVSGQLVGGIGGFKRLLPHAYAEHNVEERLCLALFACEVQGRLLRSLFRIQRLTLPQAKREQGEGNGRILTREEGLYGGSDGPSSSAWRWGSACAVTQEDG